MPITDVNENPWATESSVPASGAPSASVTDVEGNPWEAPSVGQDIRKSAVGSGLRTAASMAGGIGDIRQGASSLADWLGKQAGLSPQTTQYIKSTIGGAVPFSGLIKVAPTTPQVTSTLENAVGPEAVNYQAQSLPGSAVSTAIPFLPGLAAGPGGIVRRAVQNVAVPALGSEAAGQLFKGTDVEPIARAVGGVGGALAAGAVPTAARRAVTPFPIAPERQAALSTLQSEGVQVPASMATGSKALKAAESQLGGETYRANVDRMNQQYTQAVLRKAGINGEAATPDVLNQARTDIGDVFNTVAARNRNIPIPGFDTAAKAIAGDYQRLTGAESPALKDVISRVGGRIDGDSYQAIQSQIGRDARTTSSPELRSALYDMKSALDAAVQGGLKNTADAQLWSQARKQWGNLLTIEKAVGSTSEEAAFGQITPARLKQAIDSQKQGAYARGLGDFSPLARAGNAIMKPLQDSGTASRLGPVAKLAALGGGLAAGGIPGLASAGVGVMAPWAAGRLMMSPLGQRYLTNQALAAGPGGGNRALAASIPALLALLNANQQQQRLPTSQ